MGSQLTNREKILLGLLGCAIGAYFMSLPRGKRNNNPGNLMDTGIPWQGLVGHDPQGYAIFTSPYYGMRAMLLDLKTNIENGVNTISELVSKWAPANAGNPTAHYINYVASTLQISPNQPLSPTDALPLAQAMTQFEEGKPLYSAADWQRAWNAALAA